MQIIPFNPDFKVKVGRTVPAEMVPTNTACESHENNDGFEKLCKNKALGSINRCFTQLYVEEKKF